jgi:hypothetical protein
METALDKNFDDVRFAEQQLELSAGSARCENEHRHQQSQLLHLLSFIGPGRRTILLPLTFKAVP